MWQSHREERPQATAVGPQWDTDLGAGGRPPRLWGGAGLEVLVNWELWGVSVQRRNFLKAFLKMTVADRSGNMCHFPVTE